MTTRTKVLLIVIAAIVVYPAAAWLDGIGVQAQLQRSEQRLLDENNFLVLMSQEYHRGIYGSTQVLTYGLGGPLSHLATPAAQTLTSLRLTVRQRIHHGPIPGLRTLGLASVDSQLQWSAQAGSPLSTVLAGKTLAQLYTVIGWRGGGRSSIQSPAFQYRAADGTSVDWGGIGGTLNYSRNMDSWSAALFAPGFDIQDSKGRLQLTGLTVRASKHRAFNAFYLGDSQVKVTRFDFHPTTGNPMLIQGLSIRTNSDLSSAGAQYVDTTVNLGIDSVQTVPFTATRLSYNFGVNHLYGPSLAAITLALQDVQRSTTPVSDQSSRMLDAFRQYGPDLLLHDPAFTLERVGFMMPEGQLGLSGQLTVSGLTPQELQKSASLVLLAQHIRASFDLRADTALVDKLLGASTRGAPLAAQLQQAQNLGYIKHDGSAYTAHLEYRAGYITLNGAPYPPAAAGSTPLGPPR